MVVSDTSAKSSNSTTTKGDNGDYLWGWPIKRWTSICVWLTILILAIFLVAPFVLSMIVPLIWQGKTFEHLPSALDGMSFVLGLVGTIASLVSIAMTVADQKRYRKEKTETEQLMKSVAQLHKEIRIVDSYVRKTFEANNKLALQLYKSSFIPNNPQVTTVGVANEHDSAQWGNKTAAREIPLDSEPSVNTDIAK